MRNILIALTLLASTSAAACINGESRVLKDGTMLYENHSTAEVGAPEGHTLLNSNYDRMAQRLRDGFASSGDYAYLSDLGVVFIYQHKYAEARDLYLRIEREKPGRYATASNIGTVYELMGRNDSALLWISRAVELNPGSHNGSEWIHVNILKAKMAHNAHPGTSELLNVDFGKEPRPSASLKADDLYALRDALFFQLTERMTFVKPRDPVVAQLLFDYGNVALLLKSPISARDCYQEAQRYGFAGHLLDARMQLADALAKAGPVPAVAEAANKLPVPPAHTGPHKRAGLFWAVGIGFLLLVIFVGALLLRRDKDLPA